MTVHVDLINTGSLRENENGYDVVTEYLVTAQTGNQDSLRWNALQRSEIPRMGDAHPVVPLATVVEREVLPVANSPTKWIVRVRYESPQVDDDQDGPEDPDFGAVTWSGSTRTEEQEEFEDINGEPMLLAYRGSPTLDAIDFRTGELEPATLGAYVRHARVHSVVVDRPLQTITGRRWERQNPEQTALDFYGTVNAETWRGYPPETMLLREITFEEADDGYQVSYTFQHKANTWQNRAAFKMNSAVGPQTPHDATIGNGLETFRIYRPISFARLGL
jgi:hypothetical protein